MIIILSIFIGLNVGYCLKEITTTTTTTTPETTTTTTTTKTKTIELPHTILEYFKNRNSRGVPIEYLLETEPEKVIVTPKERDVEILREIFKFDVSENKNEETSEILKLIITGNSEDKIALSEDVLDVWEMIYKIDAVFFPPGKISDVEGTMKDRYRFSKLQYILQYTGDSIYAHNWALSCVRYCRELQTLYPKVLINNNILEFYYTDCFTAVCEWLENTDPITKLAYQQWSEIGPGLFENVPVTIIGTIKEKVANGILRFMEGGDEDENSFLDFWSFLQPVEDVHSFVTTYGDDGTNKLSTTCFDKFKGAVDLQNNQYYTTVVLNWEYQFEASLEKAMSWSESYNSLFTPIIFYNDKQRQALNVGNWLRSLEEVWKCAITPDAKKEVFLMYLTHVWTTTVNDKTNDIKIVNNWLERVNSIFENDKKEMYCLWIQILHSWTLCSGMPRNLETLWKLLANDSGGFVNIMEQQTIEKTSATGSRQIMNVLLTGRKQIVLIYIEDDDINCTLCDLWEWDESIASYKRKQTLKLVGSFKALSPDGRKLALLIRDSTTFTIEIWHIGFETESDFELLHTKKKPHSCTILFSPDSKKIAAFFIYTKGILIWNLESNTENWLVLKEWVYHGNNNILVFSPDSTKLAFSEHDSTVITNINIAIWDLELFVSYIILKTYGPWIFSLVFSPDGTKMALSYTDKTVRIWDVSGNQTHVPILLKELENKADFLMFSHDGTKLVSSLSQSPLNITVWYLMSDNHHVVTDNFACFALSPDGTELAMWQNSTLKIQSTPFIQFPNITTEHTPLNNDILYGNLAGKFITNSYVIAEPYPVVDVLSVAFCPDGKSFASGSADGKIGIWDALNSENQPTILGSEDDYHAVRSIDFHPGRTLLVSGHEDGTLKLWDLTEQNQFLQLLDNGGSSDHTDSVSSVSFSPDGRLIVSGSDDNTVKVWDLNSRTNLCTFTDHTAKIHSVAFSPNGTMIASGSDDCFVKVRDVVTRRTLTLDHTDPVTCVMFGPYGRLLVSGSENGEVKLWDLVRNGSLVVQRPSNQERIQSVVFSPDGSLLVIAYQKQLEFVNVTSGTTVKNHDMGDKNISSITFSRDGKKILVGLSVAPHIHIYTPP